MLAGALVYILHLHYRIIIVFISLLLLFSSTLTIVTHTEIRLLSFYLCFSFSKCYESFIVHMHEEIATKLLFQFFMILKEKFNHWGFLLNLFL